VPIGHQSIHWLCCAARLILGTHFKRVVYTDPWSAFSRAISFNGVYRNVT
jgi:hypothetical protein